MKLVDLKNAFHLKLVLLLCTLAQTKAADCNSSCGNLDIPYPFGTSNDCYIDERFFINCTTTTNKSSSSSSAQPIAYLRGGGIPVLNISLDPPELTILAEVSKQCYNSGFTASWNEIWFEKFSISNTKNRFTVVGCDTSAYIRDLTGKRFQTGCTLNCNNNSFEDWSCSGVGCCQTSFPRAIRNYTINITTFDNYRDVREFNPCGYAFIAQDGSFNFSARELLDLGNRTQFPVVLDWAVGDQTCVETQRNGSSYACKHNTRCLQSVTGIGYQCLCEDGFKGNPYLSHPLYGCKDINECEGENRCSMRCHNVEGNYTCSCPRGYKGNGYKDGSGCKLPVMEISLGISVGLLVVFTLVSTLCWGHKQRALKQLKRQYFEQNGGNYMLQQLYQQQGHTNRTKIFTEDELKIATNNFDESRILGRGGQGTVYKGLLPDKMQVAIKKSRVGGDPRQIKDFISEVVVLSQINHRNVVKLFGCCLETEVPLLVYEFVDNGTLLDHIDPLKNEHFLSWETRLRIAAETAGAISYLHSSASIPIIHRDIKSTNILLDYTHRAKVSDFGASRLVPLNETQVTTMVQGTWGYLDPEYLLTGQLDEKSDVYSFGVVLVELLTGNKAVEFNRPEEQRNLAMYFASSMKEDNLWEILDKRVLDQKNAEQVKEVAFLAKKCIRVNREERPTMREVAMELEGLIAMKKHPWGKGEKMMSEECEYLLDQVANGYGNASASSSAAYDSIRKQIAFEIEDGR
ncbi:hypothetical protein QN277_026744 [Acacia crassicarpa]|uniref:Uncharacterized protein n=1 Tax=Acacia crassicarpa TaxID=499986 RepID=A0AAE1JBH1_9FABA|nr:hypothetical protein QN277_026744 [Acacia crassicarpa]